MRDWFNKGFYGLQERMTEEQEYFINSVLEGKPKKKVIITESASGTGKTTLAVACSHYLRMDLFYVFSPVEENTMGYRPGEQSTKDSAYLKPLYDALIKVGEFPSKCIIQYDEQGMAMQNVESDWKVHAMSHTFLRGSNFENSVIFIDEAQNFTRSEMRKVVTRLHDNCILIVAGHLGQKDIFDAQGLERVIQVFEDEVYTFICPLTKNFRGDISTKGDQI